MGIFVSWNYFKSQYKTSECRGCSHVCLVHVLLDNVMKTNTMLTFLRLSLSPSDNDEFQLHPCLYSHCNSTFS